MSVSSVKLERPNTKPKRRVEAESANIKSPTDVASKTLKCSSSVAIYLVKLFA